MSEDLRRRFRDASFTEASPQRDGGEFTRHRWFS
jgi:hypothetical protein